MTTRGLLLVVLANIAFNLGVIRLLCHRRGRPRQAAWESLCRSSRLLAGQVRQLAADLAADSTNHQEVTW
jgi:hypothetical protein